MAQQKSSHDATPFILQDMEYRTQVVFHPKVNSFLNALADMKGCEDIWSIVGTLIFIKEKCMKQYSLWAELGTSKSYFRYQYEL